MVGDYSINANRFRQAIGSQSNMAVPVLSSKDIRQCHTDSGGARRK